MIIQLLSSQSKALKVHIMKKALFLILILLSSTSYADTWKFAGFSPDYLKSYWVNVDSIIETGGIKDVWISSVNIDKKLPYDLVLVNEKINCRTKSRKSMTSAYFLKGKTVKTFDENGSWKRAIPGSIASSYCHVVCNPNIETVSIDKKLDLLTLTKVVQNVMRRYKKEVQSQQKK